LSDYAEAIRYPGHSYPVDEAEYRQAIELADGVFRWAEGIVGVA
jgi:hypothetical protein